MNENETIEFVKSIYPNAIAVKGVRQYIIVDTPYTKKYFNDFQFIVKDFTYVLEYDYIEGCISGSWHETIKLAWEASVKILQNKIYQKLER